MDAEFRRQIYSLHSELGFMAMGKTGGNPPVSAVLHDVHGKILATGNTQGFGKDHAERFLYRNYFQNNEFPTHLSVSLEPCTHFGNTPPCKDLVLANHPVTLKIGWKDPNPLVESGNWEDYKLNGTTVSLDPLLAKFSLPFLQGFLKRIQKGKPWVVIKSATSEEGHYASLSGKQVSISAKESNLYLQMLRAKMDAIAVGPNTVKIDSPSLHFRLEEDSLSRAGDSKKVLDPTPFFHAGTDLLDTLLQLAKSKANDHIENHIQYQPFRIFFIHPNLWPDEIFFEKQNDLNKQFGKKLVLFFILDKGLDENQMSKLKSLSEFEPWEIGKDGGVIFLKTLAKLGINSLLCEAGDFFPKFLDGVMDEEDVVLEIRSKVSIPEGKLFYYHNHKMISEFLVGDDRFILRHWRS
ncbi:dihydrofolate reductase family protein [Leptospira sp. 96542]|nr:dihydrofolate reductase family protein [Leptospira sp. 96542]